MVSPILARHNAETSYITCELDHARLSDRQWLPPYARHAVNIGVDPGPREYQSPDAQMVFAYVDDFGWNIGIAGRGVVGQ